MRRTQISLFIVGVLLASYVSQAAGNELCLLAYPQGQTQFRYDPSRYEVVSSGSSSYDPTFAIKGQMLWDSVEGRIAFEAYQAPNLNGFEPSDSYGSYFFFIGSEVDLVIDGFSSFPRQLSDIYVLFTPTKGAANVHVNGVPVQGLRHRIPSFTVQTPLTGGFFSDTMQLSIIANSSSRVEALVFADRNGNQIYDGDPCFRVVFEGLTVPTEEKTWGSIKSLYAGE